MLLNGGDVKCWGRCWEGQCGYGDGNNRGDGPNETGDNLPVIDLGTGRRATQIVAGEFFTCALLDDSTVKCWGDNDAGQLGQGDTVKRGVGPNEMGDNLLAIDLGTGRTATRIEAGNENVCAILDNNDLKCWGDGLVAHQDFSREVGDQAGEMGDNLAALDLGTGLTATAITCGIDFCCATLNDNTLKCFGRGGTVRSLSTTATVGFTFADRLTDLYMKTSYRGASGKRAELTSTTRLRWVTPSPGQILERDARSCRSSRTHEVITSAPSWTTLT